MGDYAKEFHNIRRLKFSHNAGPGSREGQPPGKKRKKTEKGGKSAGPARHASPSASWDRTSILVCFSTGFDALHASARASAAVRSLTLAAEFFSFHLLHLHRDRPSIFRRRVSGRALRYFAPWESFGRLSFPFHRVPVRSNGKLSRFSPIFADFRLVYDSSTTHRRFIPSLFVRGIAASPRFPDPLAAGSILLFGICRA